MQHIGIMWFGLCGSTAHKNKWEMPGQSMKTKLMPDTMPTVEGVRAALVYGLLAVVLCVLASPSFAAQQIADAEDVPRANDGADIGQTASDGIATVKDTVDIIKNIALILFGLFTLYFARRGVRHYLNDVEMKRISDALELYNKFDKDSDCVLAMTMVDYYDRARCPRARGGEPLRGTPYGACGTMSPRTRG